MEFVTTCILIKIRRIWNKMRKILKIWIFLEIYFMIINKDINKYLIIINLFNGKISNNLIIERIKLTITNDK